MQLKGNNMEYINNKILAIIEQHKKNIMISIVILIIGLFTHGYMFMNKLPNFDDAVAMTSRGTTYGWGRWFLPFTKVLTTGKNSPMWCGVTSLIFIIIATWFIVKLLRITNELAIVLVGSILITSPVNVGIFTFMYTSDAYQLAFLLSCLSIYLLYKESGNKMVNYGLSIVCLTLSLGIYQAYLSIACTLVLFMRILENMEDIGSIQDRIKKLFRDGIIIGISLILYEIINIICMRVFQVQGEYLVPRQSIIANIPHTIKIVLAQFLSMFTSDFCGITYFKFVRIALLILSLLSVFIFGVYSKKKGGIFYFCLLPFALGIINFFSSDLRDIDTLMAMAYSLFFILPILVVNNIHIDKTKSILIGGITVTLLTGIICKNILIANYTYVGMDLVKQEAESYFTTMITQIKSLDGYNSNLPICFKGKGEGGVICKDDSATINNRYLSPANIRGTMSLERYIGMYSRNSFLEYYLGFSPELVSFEELTAKQSEYSNSMPEYPADGSIQIVDGTIIVNLLNE